MASLVKDSRGRSPYWIGCYTTDDGRRHKKSTKETDKRKAWAIVNAWQAAEDRAARARREAEAQATRTKKVLAEFRAARERIMDGPPGSVKRAYSEYLKWRGAERERHREYSRRIAEEFHSKASQAVLGRDERFFQRMAAAIVYYKKQPDILRPERYLLFAFEAYERYVELGEEALPTKRKIREEAEWMWAVQREIRQGRLVRGLSEAARREGERRIREAVKSLPEQDWSKLFRKAGLAGLPHGRGGRSAASN
jgi:hypothetical protein